MGFGAIGKSSSATLDSARYSTCMSLHSICKRVHVHCMYTRLYLQTVTSVCVCV